MGGLVARHYLELLDGWRDCRALITFGTPFRGSPQSLEYLANGYKLYGMELADVMRTFTSTYQLLPAYEVVHVGGTPRYIHEAGAIPHVSARRAEDAYRFHEAILRAVEGRAEREPYRLIPVVGNGQKTLQSAVLADGRLTSDVAVPSGVDRLLADGDGTVPRLSAIPHEFSDDFRGYFLAEKHASLQNHVQTLNDLRERLRQLQVRNLKAIRGPDASAATVGRPALRLDLEDVYLPGEPVALKVEVCNTPRDYGGVHGTIEAIDQGGEHLQVEWVRGEGAWVATPSLPPGLYRLSVSTRQQGPGAPPDVHDLFEVGG